MKDRKDNKSIAEIVAIPTLAAGAGALLGAYLGGTTTRALMDTRGVRSRLKNMSPGDLKALKSIIGTVGSAGAGTASAIGTYSLSQYVREEMDRRRSRK